MAITTLDGVVAGYQQPVFMYKIGATMEAAGVMYTPIYVAGIPGSCAANGEAIAGAAVTNNYAGMIPYVNPSSGNGYLAKFSLSATGFIAGILIDRLWHNDSMDETSTGSQTVNSAAWPARDINGSTNGEGVQVALEVSTATTNSATSATVTYTNSAGTGSRTGTISIPATAVAGSFLPMTLQAGDTGVRSIQNITFAVSLGTGRTHLVAYRLLAGPIVVPAAGAGGVLDFVGTGMVRLYDNTSPQLVLIPGTTTPLNFWSILQWVHG